MTTDRIPDFPNEVNPNPVTGLDIHTHDGTTLCLALPDVQQSRFMVALGGLCRRLDVPLDFTLLTATLGPPERRPRTTPDQEWLEHQIAAWAESEDCPWLKEATACNSLAAHLHSNWHQVKSLELLRAFEALEKTTPGRQTW